MPWHHGGCEKDERPAGTIPLIGSCPTSNTLVASSSTKTSVSELDQFHPLKRIRFTDATDFSLHREDPFYLYHSILRTMLDSWTQLINFLETDIETSRSASADAFGHSLEQLRLTSTILYRARNTILEHLPVVKLGGHNQWPKCEAFELKARKSALQQELELAINSLVGRYTNLLHECQTVSQLLVSSTQVVESQKAIQQSKEVNALTQLAFTFVPGSFIAAIFSMSVRELKVHPPGIWVFFAIALPVMLIFSLLTIKAIRRPFFRAAHSAREKFRGAIKRDGFGFER
jgi:Mg2+ and Co2+ transporter CorA